MAETRAPARLLWVAVGGVALALGALGAVLPLLPTTPFVILAGAALSKGSARHAAALHGHPVFGPVLADWRTHGAIAPRWKALALGMMAAGLAISTMIGVGAPILTVQAVAMSIAAAFILSRPNGAARANGSATGRIVLPDDARSLTKRKEPRAAAR